MRSGSLLAAVLLTLTTPLMAQRAPLPQHGEEQGLPYLDARLVAGQVRPEIAAKVSAARTPAVVEARDAELAILREQVLALALDEHELFGTPHFLRSTKQLLSAPKTGAFTPLGVVADFVERFPALFEVDAGELLVARVARDFATKHNGVSHLTLQQQVGGLDVWGAELKANVTPGGALINVSSSLLPRPSGDFAVPAARYSAQDAVLIAFANVGLDSDVMPAPLGVPQGLEQSLTWNAGEIVRADTPLSTKALLFPLDRDTIHPAWEVVVAVPGEGHTYEVMVDGVDGTVLRRWDRLHYYFGGTQDASYNVFPSDSPAPGSPGLPTPDGSQFPFVSRALVTLGGTPESPLGWIPDGANETLGNNVDAHTDLNADNAPDLPRPTGSPFRVFDFPLDVNQAPSTYRDAAVTQLFYLCNRIHDKLHGFGFDEPASNFQNDNFGLGGLGGDRLSADAQDGSGTNNANWNGSGSDGTTTWIQMYVFDGPAPDRDGDLDGDIVYHEYAHGLSIRLSGGTVSGSQSGGMGEGWGDYFGVCMSAEPGDDPDAEYCTGGYATKDFFGLQDNYYFGIRRYPYSSDLSKSPLTYADIDPAQMVIPAGIPVNTLFSGNPANEVHNAGEIWCQALLECRAALWNGGLGFAANDLLMQLVVDGMKLMPSNPNMLQSRDAILQADLVGFGGSHLGELWAGFAKRGMGASASSPSGSTTTGIVEAFDTPALILFAFPSGQPSQLQPNTVTVVPVEITGLGGDSPLPGTGLLHYSVNGGAFQQVPMVATGTNTYDAELPGFSCFDSVAWYVSTDSTAGVVNMPATAPADTYSASVFTGTSVLLDDPIEVNIGWTVGDVDDDATTGVWEWGDPNGSPAQSEDDHTPTGSLCFFTGQGSVGGSVGENDVDGGKTTLYSPTLDLSSGDARIGYWRWYNNTAGSTPNTDSWPIDISNDGGASWVNVETVGPTGADTSGGWFFHEFVVSDKLAPTGNMKLRFVASDLGDGSIVEAMIDDLQVTRLLCDSTCQTDLGFGGPGSLQLSICGAPLSSGNSAEALVTGAPSNGLVVLVVGAASNPVPFKGGTLVPVPILGTLSLTADGAGEAGLTVPGGNGPFTVYVQAVAPDGSQPKGYAISNALEVQYLP